MNAFIEVAERLCGHHTIVPVALAKEFDICRGLSVFEADLV